MQFDSAIPFDSQNDDFWTRYDLVAQQMLSPVASVRRAASHEVRTFNRDVRENSMTRNGQKPALVVA